MLQLCRSAAGAVGRMPSSSSALHRANQQRARRKHCRRETCRRPGAIPHCPVLSSMSNVTAYHKPPGCHFGVLDEGSLERHGVLCVVLCSGSGVWDWVRDGVLASAELSLSGQPRASSSETKRGFKSRVEVCNRLALWTDAGRSPVAERRRTRLLPNRNRLQGEALRKTALAERISMEILHHTCPMAHPTPFVAVSVPASHQPACHRLWGAARAA